MSTLVAEHAAIHVAFLICLMVLPLLIYNTDDKAEPCSEDLCDPSWVGNDPMNPPSIISQN